MKAKKEEAQEAPTLDEAKAMFRENPGLDNVVCTTPDGEVRVFRDGRVEPL